MNVIFKIFEDILNIPHESGNEKAVADYVIDFAQNNNIFYKLGKNNTIFLKKDNHSNKTIILQAHSDMVCVSSIDYDFKNKGIPFYIDGDYYKSRNTSLGADDGIGIAIILAMLLENDNMPNIEVMITTEEETTMLGAINFDYSLITGNTLISLDGIKEGDIESSSAGMCSITFSKKINYIDFNSNMYKLSLFNLAGGHSGDDIEKNRCNAIKFIFNVLKECKCSNINYLDIGEKDNVIPNAGTIIFSSDSDESGIKNIINAMSSKFIDEDKNFTYTLEEYNVNNCIDNSDKITNFVNELKSGLLETYQSDNFPLLSANIGKISISNNLVEIKYSIRSSDILKEDNLLLECKNIADKYDFDFSLDSRKPFFAFKENSNIRTILSSNYEILYNKKAIIKKIHACMEGGILSKNIDNLDICTIAPTIDSCHSINERVSISSTNRVYEWLKKSLQEFNIQR